jgi:exo-1,4-beta-D-glucosaminidase
VVLHLKNDSSALGFQIALRALDEHGEPVVPAFWSDNYVSLLPGESRTLTARSSSHGGDRIAAVELTGWNVSEARLSVKHGAEKNRRDQETVALPFARASTSASQPRRSDAAGMLAR